MYTVYIVVLVIKLVSTAHPRIYSYLIESENMVFEDGIFKIHSLEETTIRVIGDDVFSFNSSQLALSFTEEDGAWDSDCSDKRIGQIFTADGGSEPPTNSATVKVKISEQYEKKVLYFCARYTGSDENDRFFHLGSEPWMRLGVKSDGRFMPLWIQCLIVVALLIFSGLFSGLNLGLMSLDVTELDIMINSGSPHEKKCAKVIKPLRKRGNFLLCTILLGNVLVNNSLTILLDGLIGSGMVAVVGSTFAIVIFGEIIPQAVCSRHGLMIGAKTIWFTKFFMLITFPLSFPISLILDWALGKEIGQVYNRDRLRELLKLTETRMDLVKDEVNIITGALELSKKTVGDIMTKLEDVFMIEAEAVLDFDTMNKIIQAGYTRIPVYEGDKSNIIALLNTKDLAFVDPDDCTPLATVTKFYNHPVQFVFEDVKLDLMLQEFKKGGSHMSLVQRVNNDGPGDPFYEILGLVTLEDVIEEIIQSEIMDEFDTITDNKLRAPRKGNMKDFSVFAQTRSQNYPQLTPQLALATYQFLSTSVSAFRPELISERVLQRMIKQDVIVDIRISNDTSSSNQKYIYRAGRPADYFVMILQGKVEVEFHKEGLIFEGGSFMYFGIQALLGYRGSNPSTQIQGSLASLNYAPIPTPQDPSPPGSNCTMSPQGPTSHRPSMAPSNPIPLAPQGGQYVPECTVRAITDVQMFRVRRAHYSVALRASQLDRQRPSVEEGGSSVVASNMMEAFDREWNQTRNRSEGDSLSEDGATLLRILTPFSAADPSDVTMETHRGGATEIPSSVAIEIPPEGHKILSPDLKMPFLPRNV